MFSTSVNHHFNRYLHILFVASLIGLLSYPALSLHAEGLTHTVEVVAIIEPELSLTITPETGSRIDFGTVRSAMDEERLSDPVHVSIRVDSNLGQPYQVTQQFIQPMTSAEGLSLPEGHLIAKAHDGVFPVTTEPVILIASDSLGHSATESVAYQLRVPPAQSAGTYRGTLLMTVIAQ